MPLVAAFITVQYKLLWGLRGSCRDTVAPEASTPAVSALKEALWEKFPILSAPMFAFVPAEPTPLTFWRRTNELGCCVLCCPSPLTAQRPDNEQQAN